MAETAWVFLLALFTALATGLGAAPFLLFENPTRSWLGVSNALAAGLMLAASLGLVYEGLAFGPWRTASGVLLGLLFIMVTRRLIQHEEHPAVFASMGTLDARKAMLVVGVMTLHSFTEGVAIGVSFGGSESLGLFIALALAVHNIPEGLAISLVLVPRSVGVGRAALWSIFSSVPQPLMAVPAFLFVALFTPLLPLGLGFAAGAMAWMVFSELVPDALEEADGTTVTVVAALSAAAMVAFQYLIR